MGDLAGNERRGFHQFRLRIGAHVDAVVADLDQITSVGHDVHRATDAVLDIRQAGINAYRFAGALQRPFVETRAMLLDENVWSHDVLILSSRYKSGSHAGRRVRAGRPSAITTEALRRIAELYLIEAKLRGKPPHERRLVRQRRSRPLLDDFDPALELCRAASFGLTTRRSPAG